MIVPLIQICYKIKVILAMDGIYFLDKPFFKNAFGRFVQTNRPRFRQSMTCPASAPKPLNQRLKA